MAYASKAAIEEVGQRVDVSREGPDGGGKAGAAQVGGHRPPRLRCSPRDALKEACREGPEPKGDETSVAGRNEQRRSVSPNAQPVRDALWRQVCDVGADEKHAGVGGEPPRGESPQASAKVAVTLVDEAGPDRYRVGTVGASDGAVAALQRVPGVEEQGL